MHEYLNCLRIVYHNCTLKESLSNHIRIEVNLKLDHAPLKNILPMLHYNLAYTLRTHRGPQCQWLQDDKLEPCEIDALAPQ